MSGQLRALADLSLGKCPPLYIRLDRLDPRAGMDEVVKKLLSGIKPRMSL